MNNKGQMWGMGMVIGIVVLVVSVIIFANLIEPLKDGFDTARHENALNCESSVNVCGTTINDTSDWCYNSSKESETLSCTFIDLALPLIVIFFVLGAIAMMMAKRYMGGQDQQPAGGYPGY